MPRPWSFSHTLHLPQPKISNLGPSTFCFLILQHHHHRGFPYPYIILLSPLYTLILRSLRFLKLRRLRPHVFSIERHPPTPPNHHTRIPIINRTTSVTCCCIPQIRRSLHSYILASSNFLQLASKRLQTSSAQHPQTAPRSAPLPATT